MRDIVKNLSEEGVYFVLQKEFQIVRPSRTDDKTEGRIHLGRFYIRI